MNWLPVRSNISMPRLLKSGFSKNLPKPKVQSAGIAGSAGCCTITSLDELASFSNQPNRFDHQGHQAQCANPPIVTAIVAYASIVGMKIGWDIFSHQRALKKTIQAALGKADHKIQSDGPSPELLAVKTFLQRAKHEASFQKWVAGFVSGIGSLCILVGQFAMTISPFGLFTLATYGVGHFSHSLRLIGRHVEALSKIGLTNEDLCQKDFVKQYHRKKIKNLSLNVAGWGLYSAGAITLGTLSLGVLGVTFTSSPALAAIGIAGIGCLGLGIFSTLVFNNILTSPRFTPFIPMWLKADAPPTREMAVAKLASICSERKLIKEYRRHFFDHRKVAQSRFLGKALHGALRFSSKLLFIVTLGQFPALTGKIKKSIKIKTTKWFYGPQEHRVKTLLAMQGQDPSNTNEDNLLNVVAGHPHQGGIAKLLAHKTGHHSYRLGVKYGWPKWKSTWKVSDQHPFFQKAEVRELLEVLGNLKPCCSGNYEAQELFELVETELKTQNKEALELKKILEEVTDQYLVYQMPTDLKRERCFWSQYLSAFPS